MTPRLLLAVSLPVFPPEASVQAASTDGVLLGLVVITGLILLLVFGLILGFSYRYRNGSPAKRGTSPSWISRDVEIGWTVATLFLALFIAWWTTTSTLGSLAPKPGSLQIHVVAKQWMWKTQHPNGAREINALHVPTGEPVTLVMTSEDVIHSFFVPAFRIKQDVLPGRYTQTWFTATTPGTYHLFCTQLCGIEHSRMVGDVVAMKPDDYARWTAAQPTANDLAAQGEMLFRSLGCSGCHANARGVKEVVHAPHLEGIYGRHVHLSDGRTALVDDAYIRDSILMPSRDIVAGYDNIMPSFDGQLDDGQIVALTAYIRSMRSQ